MAVNCSDPCAWTASATCVACCLAYLGLYWLALAYLGLSWAGLGLSWLVLASLGLSGLGCAVIGLVWFALLNALWSLHWHLIVACLVWRWLARVIVTFWLEANAVILVVCWTIGCMLWWRLKSVSSFEIDHNTMIMCRKCLILAWIVLVYGNSADYGSAVAVFRLFSTVR